MFRPYSRADLHFELRAEIGAEGRNSQVYEAHDPQLDALLVIKKVSKASLDADGYFRESSLLYGSAHSNVVPIHYACQDDGHVYLAMPMYAAGSLKSLMGRRFLTVRETVVFATQFLSGLHHIHSKRLVHFDIKPDNVLISERGEALLSDFGLAKPRGNGGVAGQDRLYSKMVPPEAFQTDHFDHRFDIYQTGLTLYRMCMGDVEFYSQFDSYVVNDQLDRIAFRHAVTNSQFPNTTTGKFPEHIPERLITVIKKCLQTNPADRYSSAIEIVNDLAPIEGELLDWQYQMGPDGRSWTKTHEGTEIALTLSPEGRSEATKRVNGGAPRRIATYCGNQLNRQQIKQFLREN
ncbi:serine/threonine-protein kinase [Thermomonas fusca]|uniref:serine/threonine-protein kinase n=1 Tax=Thermomonas fusca TaxID=215690 RepID=UPI000A005FCC|nr:serine/threonine-protein kinase [Thermomonas fusca]